MSRKMESTQQEKLTLNDISTTSGVESKRPVWNTKLEYLLSLIGYSVGLGNVWRFPYLVIQNGGGAFLIPFVTFLFLCGIPLYFLEVALGQYAGQSAITVWSVSPVFKGVGYCMALVSGITCVYYNVIIAWFIYYLGNSFLPELPWQYCGQEWNTDTCVGPRMDVNKTLDSRNISSKLTGLSASEEFWRYNVLNMSTGIENLGSLEWRLLLSLIAAWILVFGCLFKGVRSLGKVVYVTATLPYIILTIFLVRGLTLDGASDGIKFYFEADFSRLLDVQVWIQAAMQVFYSLGPAWGGLLTMASYNKFHNNCLRDAIMVPLIESGSSIYSGLVVFSILGFMAKESGKHVRDFARSGPGLVLVAYPEAISKLPVPHLWAVLFFLMLLTVGLDTQFGMFETLSSGLCDRFPKALGKNQIYVTGGIVVFLFLLGIPMTTQGGIFVYTLMDWYASTFSLLFVAFLECVIITWIYGMNKFNENLEAMLGRRCPFVFALCIKVITPALLLIAWIFTIVKYESPYFGDYVFPGYARGIGFGIGIISLLPIPIFFVRETMNQRGNIIERVKKGLRPSVDWQPNKSSSEPAAGCI